jgi:hypothetical protein
MVKFCPECAHPIIDDNKPFCPKCGNKLPITSPDGKPPENQPSAVTQPERPSWYIPPVNSAATSVQTPATQSQMKESTTKKRSIGEWTIIVCGGIILLVILSAFLSGFIAGISGYSISGKNNLNIGDSAILSSKGNSISVKVIEFNQITGITNRPNHYGVTVEVKNVGRNAIQGSDDVKMWITDRAGVSYGTSNFRRSVAGESGGFMPKVIPLYPGEVTYSGDNYDFSDKSLEGKLTFYYQFGDDTASWIVKS